MTNLIVVGLGSFLGGISRYYLSGVILHTFISLHFPLGTFLVNFIGCFLIGIFGGLAEHRDMFSPQLRLFVMTGVLGGFTTFSAFGYETIYLMRTHGLDLALLNMGLSVGLCLLAVWVGLQIV